MLTYTEISNNKRKTVLLIISFLVVITAFGYVVERAFNNPAIIIFAFVLSCISAWFSYYFSDKITLAISSAHAIDRQNNQTLYRIVENLAIAGGLPTPKIYVIEDRAMNAFATGRDPNHAVICVTSGLLEKMDKTELEGVIAHELSHIGNYDIRLSTLVVVLVGLFTLLADWFLRFSFFGGGRRRDNNGDNNAQAIFFVVGIILAIIAPVIALIIQLAISRKREYLADASGALLTRYPEGLASALEKIKLNQMPLAEANKATAHLYIVNPLNNQDSDNGINDENKTSSTGLFANLFNTHPPLDDRIKKLRQMNLG